MAKQRKNIARIENGRKEDGTCYKRKGWAAKYATDAQAIREGRVIAPKTKTRKLKFRKQTLTDFQRQERLVFVAACLRRNRSHQQIISAMQKKWRYSKATCQKYIKKVYMEFQEKYTAEDRAVLMYEHLEALNQGALEALQQGQLMAFEKCRRQYAECLGLIIAPATMSSNVQVNVQKEDERDLTAANLTMQKLENLSATDLYQRLTGVPEASGINDSRTKIGMGSSSETRLLGESSSDNDERETA